MRQKFKDVEFEDRVRCEDDVGKDELVCDNWRHVFDILQVARINDIQSWERDEFLRNQHEVEFDNIGDVEWKYVVDVEIDQSFVLAVLLNRQPFYILQLLYLKGIVSQQVVKLLCQS